MDNLSFEQKILMLAATKAGKEKQDLLNRFTFGDLKFTSRYYYDAVSLDKYMEANKERFQSVVEEVKEMRKNIKNHGWTDKKYQRLLGRYPECLDTERPEFSKYLPQKERERNIKMFFQKYPQFRLDV